VLLSRIQSRKLRLPAATLAPKRSVVPVNVVPVTLPLRTVFAAVLVPAAPLTAASSSSGQWLHLLLTTSWRAVWLSAATKV